MKQIQLLIATVLVMPLIASAAPPTTQQGWNAERRLRISSNDPAKIERTLQYFQDMKSELSDYPKIIHAELHNLLLDCGMNEGDLKVDVDFVSKTVDLSILAAKSGDDATVKVDRVAREFIERIMGPSQSQQKQIAQDEEQFQRVQDQIGDLKNRHDAEEGQLRKQTGAVDVSPASVRERMASLQTQKESATIELATKQARSDALAEQISKFSSQIQDKIKNDPIAAELSKVVDVRQKEFDRAQAANKAGGASQGEVDQAMAPLAEAKAKFLERQEAAASAAGGDIVAGWNRELMTLSVDIAELNARSKALDDRLAVYANADEYLDNADQWLAEINDLQKQASALQEKTNNDQAEYERNHVSIDVIKDSAGATTQPSK